MKKTKLTRSLLAACSIVALTAVMYGCVHSGDGPSQAELDAEAARAAAAEAAAAAAAEAQAEAEAAAAAAAEAAAAAAAEAQEELDEAQAEIDARDAAAASATAAALKAALGASPLNNLTPLTATEPTGAPTGSAVVPSLTPTGLMLGISARAADGTPNTAGDGLVAATVAGSITGAARTPRMAPGDSAGMLGVWAGTDYAHTSSLTGVNNSAVTFRNRADAVMIPFAAGASFGANEAAFDAAYTRATRTLDLDSSAGANDPAASFDIAGDMFPTAGSITYTTADSGVDSVMIAGTYQGASGDYHCAGTCSAAATSAGIDLTGDWYFVHDEGAAITSPDSNYLYFGWWLQKDGTGTPANVGAFTGRAGTAAFATVDLSTAVTGTATYAGHAAGKFAISNPIGADDAGHFTADAELTATFGANAAPNNGGVTGTLDSFMLNDAEEEAGWEVTLLRATWDGAAGLANTPTADDATTALDETMGTIWSVGGNAAAESGSWSAQFYDEAQGAADDGSNVPTSVTGTFQSHFGEFMTMVGAFGAERTE